MEHAIQSHKKTTTYVSHRIKTSNNKEIYSINYLLQCKIMFEQSYSKKEIPQCTKCQRYGHTKNFCNHKVSCVKCAGNYATDKC